MGNFRKLFLAFFQNIYLFLDKIPLIGNLAEISGSLKSCLFRLMLGNTPGRGSDSSKKPDQLLKLYEFEACPFCRIVRENLCYLRIDTIIYPCPRETFKKYGHMENSRFRPKVMEMGGKLVFPYLIDENRDHKMYESRDIASYLWQHYGQGVSKSSTFKNAFKRKIFKFSTLFHAAARPLPRHGMLRTPSKKPQKLLELWSLEHHWASKIVRERLCSLEIPYILRQGKHPNGSLPYLIDPNLDQEFASYSKICKHLNQHYQSGETTRESFAVYGEKD